ncbi:Helicase SWR1 [Trichinella spiralis]|uniref:Helicase SWR1 n=1 Tax=Trichinella spiralis TaxID=6334 RepID=A0ABR3KK48_TRISP
MLILENYYKLFTTLHANVRKENRILVDSLLNGSTFLHSKLNKTVQCNRQLHRLLSRILSLQTIQLNSLLKANEKTRIDCFVMLENNQTKNG